MSVFSKLQLNVLGLLVAGASADCSNSDTAAINQHLWGSYDIKTSDGSLLELDPSDDLSAQYMQAFPISVDTTNNPSRMNLDGTSTPIFAGTTPAGGWFNIGDAIVLADGNTAVSRSWTDDVPTEYKTDAYGTALADAAAWNNWMMHLWVTAEDASDVRIKCDGSSWGAVKITRHIGYLCGTDPGAIGGAGYEPAVMLDAIGLQPRDGMWGDWLVRPGAEYHIGQHVEAKSCDFAWPHHGLCPDSDPNCMLSSTTDAKMLCDGNTGNFSTTYGVELHARVTKANGTDIKENCNVTDASLAELLKYGNKFNADIACDSETGMATDPAQGCDHQDPTGDDSEEMFTIISGHASCTEGHIEPGYLFKIGNAVSEGDAFHYEPRDGGYKKPEYLTVECNGEDGKFINLRVDTSAEGVVFGKLCDRDDPDLIGPDGLLANFGLKPQTSYLNSLFSPSSPPLEPEDTFSIGHAVEADDGQDPVKFYYGYHTAGDISVICRGRDGSFSPINASTNVLVRAPENPGEESKGVLHKCNPEAYSAKDSNYDEDADKSGLGALIGADGIGLMKDDQATEAFAIDPIDPKQLSTSFPSEIGVSVKAMTDGYNPGGDPIQYGYKGIGGAPKEAKHVTIECDGDTGRFTNLQIDYEKVRLGRTCARAESDGSNLKQLLADYDLDLGENPNIRPGFKDFAGDGLAVGLMVTGLGKKVYNGFKSNHVVVYCNGADGQYHNLEATPEGKTKVACNSVSGWTPEEIKSSVGDPAPSDWDQDASGVWRGSWKQLDALLYKKELRLKLDHTLDEVLPDKTKNFGDQVEVHPDFPQRFYSGDATSITVSCDGGAGDFEGIRITAEQPDQDNVGEYVTVYGLKCDPGHSSLFSLLAKEGLKATDAAKYDQFVSYYEVDAAGDYILDNDDKRQRSTHPNAPAGFHLQGPINLKQGGQLLVEADGWIAPADSIISPTYNGTEQLTVICSTSGAFTEIVYGEGNKMCDVKNMEPGADLNARLSEVKLQANMMDPFFDTMVGANQWFHIGHKVEALDGSFFYTGTRASSVRIFCNGQTGLFEYSDLMSRPDADVFSGEQNSPVWFPASDPTLGSDHVHCDAEVPAEGCRPQTTCDASEGVLQVDTLLEMLLLKRKTNKTAWVERAAPGVLEIGDAVEVMTQADMDLYPGGGLKVKDYTTNPATVVKDANNNDKLRSLPNGLHLSGPKKADGSGYDTLQAHHLKIYCKGSDGLFDLQWGTGTADTTGTSGYWDAQLPGVKLDGLVREPTARNWEDLRIPTQR
jgi:hypothetical protein